MDLGFTRSVCLGLCLGEKGGAFNEGGAREGDVDSAPQHCGPGVWFFASVMILCFLMFFP